MGSWIGALLSPRDRLRGNTPAGPCVAAAQVGGCVGGTSASGAAAAPDCACSGPAFASIPMQRRSSGLHRADTLRPRVRYRTAGLLLSRGPFCGGGGEGGAFGPNFRPHESGAAAPRSGSGLPRVSPFLGLLLLLAACFRERLLFPRTTVAAYSYR